MLARHQWSFQKRRIIKARCHQLTKTIIESSIFTPSKYQRKIVAVIKNVR